MRSSIVRRQVWLTVDETFEPLYNRLETACCRCWVYRISQGRCAAMTTSRMVKGKGFSSALGPMCSRSRLGGVLSAAMVLVLMPKFTIAAVPVIACGQVVIGGGYLTGDLDCSATNDVAVRLDGRSLDLRGFTLHGSTSFISAIVCTRSCKVHSTEPGGIVSGGGISGAPEGGGSVRLRVSNVIVDSPPGTAGGVETSKGNVMIEDSVISNSGGTGVFASRTVSISNSSVSGHGGVGVYGDRVKVKNSSIIGNQSDGVRGGKVSVKDSLVSANTLQGIKGRERTFVKDSVVELNGTHGVAGSGVGFNGGNIKVFSSEILNNGEHGIFTDRPTLTVTGSTISGNWLDGIHDSTLHKLKVTTSAVTNNGRSGIYLPWCRGARITDSTLTGNATDGAYCGTTATCADLSACGSTPPVFVGSVTCDTSYDVESGFPGNSLGVCSLD